MNLVTVELRRLRWRRITKGVAAAFIAFLAILTVGTFMDSQPPTAQEQQQAQQWYDQAKRDWDANAAQQIAQCTQSQAETRAGGDTNADFHCDSMKAPEYSDFGRPLPTLERLVQTSLAGAAPVLMFLALIVGASFIGAEFTSGSIATFLTFEPRRVRVGTAKLVAVALWVLVAAIAGTALVWSITWGVGQLHAVPRATLAAAESGLARSSAGVTGDPFTVEDSSFAGSLWVSARTVLLSALAGVAGSALGLLLRNTTATLAVVIGYLVVGEGILGNLFGRRLQPWLVQGNVRAVQIGGADYSTDVCTSMPQGGQSCESINHHLSMAHGGIYLAVCATTLIALALWSFRRRDLS